MRANFITLIGLLFSYWASTAIYIYIIVPNLESTNRVPVYWWLGMYSPIAIVAVLAGYKIKEIKYLFILALVGAVVYVVNEYIKAVANFPGYLKSNLVEGNAASFVINFGIFAVLLFGVFVIGSLGEKVKQKYTS